jgi:hypothetical protein
VDRSPLSGLAFSVEPICFRRRCDDVVQAWTTFVFRGWIVALSTHALDPVGARRSVGIIRASVTASAPVCLGTKNATCWTWVDRLAAVNTASHEVGEIRRGRQSWLQCGDINTEVGLSHGRHHLIFLAIIVGLLTVAVLLVGRRRSSGVNQRVRRNTRRLAI